MAKSKRSEYEQWAIDFCDNDPTKFRQLIIWQYAEEAGVWLTAPELSFWYKREKSIARKMGTMYISAIRQAGGGKKQKWDDKASDIAELLELGKDWYGFRAWAIEQEAIADRAGKMAAHPFGTAVRDMNANMEIRLMAWNNVCNTLRVAKSVRKLFLQESTKVRYIADGMIS